MTLKQLQLIIVDSLGLNDANHKATPVVKPIFNKSTDGKDRNEDSFRYISVVGSLSCLSGCTRPDV